VVRNVLMTHYDLDGVCCDIILSNLFTFNKKIKSGYNRIDGFVLNGDLMFYDSCFVTDISLKSEHIQSLTNEYKNKFFYTDHHIVTKKELDNVDIIDSTILFNDKISATAGIYQYFFSKKKTVDKRLYKLTTYVDAYDMWRYKTHPYEFNIGHELNVLFWHFKYDYFFNRFRNGYVPYTDEEEDVLDIYYDTRKKVIEGTENVEIGSNSIVYIGVDQTYVNEFSLINRGYDTYYMIYVDGNNSLRLSLRTDRDDANFGEHIKGIEPLFTSIIKGGGHKQAAGMSFKPGTELNYVFDVIEYLNYLDEDKEMEIPYNLFDVPF